MSSALLTPKKRQELNEPSIMYFRVPSLAAGSKESHSTLRPPFGSRRCVRSLATLDLAAKKGPALSPARAEGPATASQRRVQQRTLHLQLPSQHSAFFWGTLSFFLLLLLLLLGLGPGGPPLTRPKSLSVSFPLCLARLGGSAWAFCRPAAAWHTGRRQWRAAAARSRARPARTSVWGPAAANLRRRRGSSRPHLDTPKNYATYATISPLSKLTEAKGPGKSPSTR